jgi:hypothetical protein
VQDLAACDRGGGGGRKRSEDDRAADEHPEGEPPWLKRSTEAENESKHDREQRDAPQEIA